MTPRLTLTQPRRRINAIRYGAYDNAASQGGVVVFGYHVMNERTDVVEAFPSYRAEKYLTVFMFACKNND